MRVAYVLPEPVLSGGNKVVFQHATLLAEIDWEVTVLGRGPRPMWPDYGGAYLDLSDELPALAAQDLVIATFWETIEPALSLRLGPVAHLCQGYEGDLDHLRDQREAIEAAYSRPLPAMVVAPHLGALLVERFGRPSRVVPPPLDPLFRPARPRFRPRRRPWIAVPGIFEAQVKDVPTALETVALLERRGITCSVLRISSRELTREESELRRPDRYLMDVPPAVVADALRRCDLMLFSSRAAEGFGLPLLEAMASGVPAVASDIPSVRFFADGGARIVPSGDPEAFADAAAEILGAPRRWRRRRRAGLEVLARFRPEMVRDRLTSAIAWASSEAIRMRDPEELQQENVTIARNSEIIA